MSAATQSTPNAIEALENPSTKPFVQQPPRGDSPRGLLCESAEALDAQLSLWKLQLTITLVRVGMGFVLGLVLFALAVYGFTLLDQAAHWPLTRDLPPWVSPLVRGFVYVAVPLLILRPALALLIQKDPPPIPLREEHTHAA